jgi:hypothetical protein
MTTNVILFVTVVFSVGISMFIVDAFINRMLKGKMAVSEIPVAVSLLKGVSYFVSAMVVTQINAPMNAVIKIMPALNPGNGLLLGVAPYYSMFLALSLFSIILLFWLTTICWNLFSKGRNIYFEVSNNNLALTILFCAIFIGLAFAAQSALLPVLDSLVPYPEMPVYR